jgi:hypothetical protein
VAYKNIAELTAKRSELISLKPRPVAQFNIFFYVSARNRSVNQKFCSIAWENKLYSAFQILDENGVVIKEMFETKDQNIVNKLRDRLGSLPNDIEVNIAY